MTVTEIAPPEKPEALASELPVIIVAGPTASGKSGLALALAERFSGTVINADSMQVYRELAVITARPSAADVARVPHRLFGVLPAAERCSVGRWLGMAAEAIAEARGEGRLPIVAGGTGLYLKALTEGLAPVPPVPEEVTAASGELYDRQGGDAFRAGLAELDPVAAARLPAGDRQRLIRAHAVACATGKPLSDWQAAAPAGGAVVARFLTILIDPPRDALYAACDARFDAMLAAGAVDEVLALDALALDPGLPAMRALGVPDLIAHVRGGMDLETAAARAKQATRNFAKRQVTWFRHQLIADLTLGAGGPEAAAHAIVFLENQGIVRVASARW